MRSSIRQCIREARAKLVARKLVFPKNRIDAQKDSIVLACHDASRSGAPILGWNLAHSFSKRFNVIVLLVKGGTLEGSFDRCAAAVVKRDGFNDAEASNVARRIVEAYRPLFVIANSVETRRFVPA